MSTYTRNSSGRRRTSLPSDRQWETVRHVLGEPGEVGI